MHDLKQSIPVLQLPEARTNALKVRLSVAHVVNGTEPKDVNTKVLQITELGEDIGEVPVANTITIRVEEQDEINLVSARRLPPRAGGTECRGGRGEDMRMKEWTEGSVECGGTSPPGAFIDLGRHIVDTVIHHNNLD